ncbi:MAG TPA: aldehyde dehydrogenase family protein, partial [Gemmatimonadaceae bacterium]|nr:aldehyde dehydrogenase family protein [Gemmatimonadaceae bacterium]
MSEVAEARGAEVASRDPVSGAVWRRFEALDEEGVREAVARARRAQPAWAACSARARARVVARFHDLLVERRADAARTIRREMGKPAQEALASEVVPVLDHARFLAREAPRALRTRRLHAGGLAHLRKRVTIAHEPFGVIGVISPWNYPLMLAAAHVLPALVAGNAVVLKPSELTTSTGVLLVELLHEAGVPAEVLQLVPGAAVTGTALVETCDKIFFTGSEATGRAIAHRCAERLIPCVLELGGSDPAIVLDDAAVEVAAAGIAWGRFSNCGQTCVAPKRVFVVDAVYDRFVGALGERISALSVGDPDAGA